MRFVLPLGALAACCAAVFLLSRENTSEQKNHDATSQPVAAAQPVSTEGPRWLCEQPTLDFGEVWEGATVQRDFTFRNTGTELLKIDKPKAHCTCSTTPNYTKEVPPGGSGVIPFVLKTNNKPHGPINEYLDVGTNDPTTRTARIWLKGFVRDVVDPEVVYDATYEKQKAAGRAPPPVAQMKGAFGRITAGDRLHRVIRLRNTGDQPLTLAIAPPSPPPPFQVELKETVSGQEFELTIKAEPPIPVGHSSALITLPTNVAARPSYQLWISTYVPPRIEILPPKTMLIDPDNYPQKEREIRITNNGMTPVDVLGISTSEPMLGITLKPRDPGKPNEQVIKIVLPGGESYRPPPWGEVIEITTNDAEMPTISLSLVPSLSVSMPRPADRPLVMHPVPLETGGR